MAYASKSGRARTSSSHPEAFGVCQRCGIWYNRVRLRNQMAWRGAAMLPTWLFVCDTCYDTPQQNGFRAIVIPADPIPVQLALPEDFDNASSTLMTLSEQTIDPQTGLPVLGNTSMQTTDGVGMGPTPTGRPPGYDALNRTPPASNDVVTFMAQTGGAFMGDAGGAFMATELTGTPGGPGDPVPPLPDDANRVPVQYGATLPVISMMANGTPLVTCTCNAPHGLALNSQVFVRGSAAPLADGLFSVIPITATAFTYGTYSPVPAGSILGQNTLVVTVLIGLPRQFVAVPQTGLPQSRPTKTSQ